MKTPRTDAAKFRIGDSDHFAVHVTHSEQLERELAAMTDLADQMAKTLWEVNNCRIFYEESLDIDNYIDDYAIDEVKEALAAYENHKTNTP